MALIDVEIQPRAAGLPRAVEGFLDEATERIRVFVEEDRFEVPGFVPSDFDVVFRALQAVVNDNLATGDVFCEWGSGFGVVALLASLLEFQAYGIEIDRSLVDCSRRLADDFDLPVDFIKGSLIPRGGEPIVERLSSTPEIWLTSTADDAYEELGMTLADFDVVYAFPWPGEQDVLATLFDEFAAVGALFLTLDQMNGVRAQRKVVG